MKKRALIFTPDRNSGTRRDFTGAFLPEAQAFAKLHDAGPIVRVNVAEPLRERTNHVLAAIQAVGQVDVLAFFCHGFPRGLQLVGDRTVRVAGSVHVEARQETMRKLAAAIAAHATPNVRVVLYACSAGDGPRRDGDEGFADSLRDALCSAGATRCVVFAHTTAGHATQNPHVRVFAGEGSAVGGTGGTWIAAPGSKLWPAWRRGLRGDLRFRFPGMTTAQVHAELLSVS
jgi:hypothetical protein